MIEGDVNTLLALSSQLFQEEFANPNYDTSVMSIIFKDGHLHNLLC